jgi:hypothetical protein
MARLVIVVGVLLLLIGLAWPWLSKLGLGRLPGDIVIRREGFSFYFPVVTCVVVSLVGTLILWLLRK